MKTNKTILNSNKVLAPMMILFLAILIFSCRNESQQEDDLQEIQMNQQDTLNNRQVQIRAYSGTISGMNTQANEQSEVTGEVAIRVEGDLVRFVISAENLAPDMMHRQFLVAAGSGEATNCPGPDSDANKDGIVDMNEIAGKMDELRMIPLHMGPSTLERNVDTYPRSNINGELQFSRTTSLDSIETAVRDTYGMQDFDISNFVYIIQGVAGDVSLQQTVQREQKIPPQQTVPVGCATLEETEVNQ